jgi:hypothetical protein
MNIEQVVADARVRAAADEARLYPWSQLGESPKELLAELRQRYGEAPDDERPRCPALLPDELECDGVTHRIGELTSRQCGLVHYRNAKVELGDLLTTLFAGRVMADPLGDCLRALLGERPVEGLPLLLTVLDVQRAKGFRGQSGHVGISGDIGCAKTHALLCLHFSALYSGVRSTWVTTARLEDIAKRRKSYDDVTVGQAEGELRTLRMASILCFDDLGDRHCGRNDEPGSSPIAGVLLDLLSAFPGRIFMTSNLSSEQRDKHPDIGRRVNSRLTADHRGVPAMGAKLKGTDQRKASARSYLERTAGDE